MDAIEFSTVRLQTMADGTLRISVDIEPRFAQSAFTLFGAPGLRGAMARLTNEAKQQEPAPADYGQAARVLKLSGFFRCPDVWEAIGTDAQFLAWLRDQPCAFCNVPGPSEAAHVRRVANGAGTGIKPPYSAIPLCHAHHEAQHQHGEGAIKGKDQVDRWRIQYLEHWAWDRFKALLGYESMAQIPPAETTRWANENGVAKYLPTTFREGVAWTAA